MKKVNSCAFLIICVACLSLALDYNKKYCFRLTWVAHDKSEQYNCSMLKGVPCIEPLIRQDTPPNTSSIWVKEDESRMCTLTSGNVCLKYTFMFNNDIVNTSMFCGKMVEDQATAVTSGCFQQKVDGHTVEVCACQSRRGREPCNAAIKIKYSVILISLVLIIMNFI